LRIGKNERSRNCMRRGGAWFYGCNVFVWKREGLNRRVLMAERGLTVMAECVLIFDDGGERLDESEEKGWFSEKGVVWEERAAAAIFCGFFAICLLMKRRFVEV
jgi:hypothetical protein